MLILDIHNLLQELYSTLRSVMTMRVHIIDIISHDMSPWEQSQRMIEMERLVSTYGGLVIIKTMQKKDIPAYRTYIGK